MPLEVSRLYPSLNAPSGVPVWWTPTQLETWASMALAALGDTGVWQDAVASADDRTLATQAVLLNGRVMRIATQAEVEAEGEGETGPARKVVVNPLGYTFHPVEAGTVLAFQTRAPIESDNLPGALFVLARWKALAAARSGEHEGAMPEVAAQVDQLVDMVAEFTKEVYT